MHLPSARSLVGPAALALFAAVVGACDSSTDSTRSASTSARTASTPATARPTAQAAPDPPDALDIGKLEQQLKCGGKSELCELLAHFKGCKDWNPVTPSGDGRWLGRAFVVKQGVPSPDFAVVRARAVPQSDVGPGQLPAKIAVQTLPEGPARVAAPKAIEAFLRADVPAQTNEAVRWTKNEREWSEAFAMRAKGSQVYIAIDNGAFACEGDARRLYVVRLAANRDGSADGLYAELWPVSW